MKNPINKRIFRQIKNNPFRTIPLFIALVLVVVFSSSFFTSQDSIRALYYEQLDNGKIEDGQFITINTLTNDLKKKLEDQDVTIYENFNIEVSQERNKKLKAFKNRKNINIGQILEGKLASNDTEVAISANYARANNIKLNDQIKLSGKNFKVVGLVSLPDYSSILRNRNDLVMDTGYYGVCLFDEKGFESFDFLPVEYRYSYHTNHKLDKKESRKKLKNLVEIINKENLVTDGVTRFDNHCITYIMDDMDGDVPTMTIFMIILFIALAFISAVEVKSLIEKESAVIGSLLSSGYTKKELLKNYMAMPLLVTLVSSIIGNIISYTYAYKKYVFLYYQSFDLPNFKLVVNLRSFLITSIVPLTIYLIINFLVIYRSLRFTPLDFLRGNLRKEKKRNKIKLRNMNFLKKFRLRIAFDNKLNLGALLFGVFLANTILTFALSVKPVFNNYTENMKDSMKYSYTYFVKTEQKDIKADKASLLSIELVNEDDKKVQIYGLDKASKYKIKNYENLKEDEIVVSKGFIDRFSYKMNDKIKIREPYKNKEISLKIKGIDYDNNLFELFTKRESLNSFIDKDKDYFNAYLSDKKLKISKDNLISQVDKNEMTKFMEHFLNDFGVVFDVLFVVGLGFYLIMTSIISNIIIDKSKLNISYLKIFGFNDKELTKIYIKPMFIMLIIFQLLVIPLLDKIIKNLILISMSKFDAYILADIPLSMYLKSIVFSIVIFILVQISQRIKISKVDMVKELKTING